ncbi:sigma-70 family RNA polymerase sigma factor [Patescibacteria group bacterium]
MALTARVLSRYCNQLSDDSTQAGLERKWLNEALWKALEILDQREYTIVVLYYGLEDEPLGLKEIGNQLGMSKANAGRIKQKALMKLRRSRRVRFLRDFLPGSKSP